MSDIHFVNFSNFYGIRSLFPNENDLKKKKGCLRYFFHLWLFIRYTYEKETM